MPAVDERQHVCRDGATQVSGSLGRSEVATIGEGGEDVALGRLLDLGVRAGQRTEVPGPARPVGHIAQDLDDAAFGHAVEDGGFQGTGPAAHLLGLAALEYRNAILADDHLAVLR